MSIIKEILRVLNIYFNQSATDAEKAFMLSTLKLELDAIDELEHIKACELDKKRAQAEEQSRAQALSSGTKYKPPRNSKRPPPRTGPGDILLELLRRYVNLSLESPEPFGDRVAVGVMLLREYCAFIKRRNISKIQRENNVVKKTASNMRRLCGREE
jgi:hypothetical protein